jgi:hypothetical protein
MGIPLLAPILFGDNKGSQFWAENPVTEKKSKHVDIRYHFIRDLVAEGKIAVSFIQGSKNPADLLTKNLDVILFRKFIPRFGIKLHRASSKEE